MKTIAVIGSRSFSNNVMLRSVLDAERPDTIVSGGARGADQLASFYAKEEGILLKEYLPEYEKYGQVAPIVRNKEIVDNADKVIAFWDGSSKGTQHAVEYAHKMNKQVEVYDLSKSPVLNRSAILGEPQDREEAWRQYKASETNVTKAANKLRAAKERNKTITDESKQFEVAYSYSKEHFKEGSYASLEFKDNVYLVTPSSSGNMFPLALATILQEKFGGDIISDFAVQNHPSGTKDLRGIDKVFAERDYTIKSEAIKNLSGKTVVLVDDLVSTGGTIDVLREKLFENGVKVNAVCSLVMTSSMSTEKSLLQLSESVEKISNDPHIKEKVEAVFHNSLGQVTWKLQQSTFQSEENAQKILDKVNERYLNMVQSLKVEYPAIEKQTSLFENPGVKEPLAEYESTKGKEEMNITGNEKLSQEEINKILDRSTKIRERLAMPDVPEELRKLSEEMLHNSLDGLVNLQGGAHIDNALDELRAKNVPHAVAMIDFRNLGGLNDTLGHQGTEEKPGANEIIKKVINEHLGKRVKELGGEIYRVGGDEYQAVVPYMTAKGLDAEFKAVQKKIDSEVIERYGLQNVRHPKHYGLPTGVGIDYGCADSSMGNDRNMVFKVADRMCMEAKDAHKSEVAIREGLEGRIWVKMEFENKEGKRAVQFAPEAIAAILQKTNREVNHERRNIENSIAESGVHGQGFDNGGILEMGGGTRGSRSDKESKRSFSDGRQAQTNTGSGPERDRPENGELKFTALRTGYQNMGEIVTAIQEITTFDKNKPWKVSEKDVEEIINQYAQKEVGFIKSAGVTDQFHTVERERTGQKLWQNMTAEDKKAEVTVRIIEDLKIAREEIKEKNPADYLLDRALDPLDPMRDMYRVVLKNMGAEITDGKIKLPENMLTESMDVSPKKVSWDPKADQKDVEKMVLDLVAYAKSLKLPDDVIEKAIPTWTNTLKWALNTRGEENEAIKKSIEEYHDKYIKKSPAKEPPKGPDLGMDL